MKRHPRAGFNRQGFTLVELLVVIAIIGILVALLLPAVQSARESARRLQCANQLKQLALAARSYHTAHETFPPGYLHSGVPKPSGSNWCFASLSGGSQYGRAPWSVLILPYLEQSALYDQFDLSKPFNGNDGSIEFDSPNAALIRRNAAFCCPTAPPISPGDRPRSNYLGVQGGGEPSCSADSKQRQFFLNGVLFHNSGIRLAHIRDGASNVLLIGETKYAATHWAAAAKITTKSSDESLPMTLAGAHIQTNTFKNGGWLQFTRTFGSDHPGGAHFALADGSVHFISESIDHAMYQQLAQRADGLPYGGVPVR